jgi:LTXXQ motif family protein
MAWDRWGGHHWGPGWHRWGGWAGPVFWPYLYGDVFSYLLWPGANDDPFWTYGPDYILSSVYWPGPYYADGSDAQYDGLYDVYGAGAPPEAVAQQTASSPSGTMAACSGLAPDVTNLPIERIRQAVQPTGVQIKELDDLQSAASTASAVVAASCPSHVPLTPLDRLGAVESRLEAMIQAVQIVRGPLDTFYGSLSEGQKQRLSAIGGSANIRSPAAGGLALCDPRASSFAHVPVDRIERTIQPSQQQETAFQALKAASDNAANELEASCPAKVPQTPVERIDAVEARLRAMVQAADTVRPVLAAFYATLSDEQKARFNVLPLDQASPYAVATQPAYASAPTYSATTINRGAFRSVTDCLNAASAAHVPLDQCS